MSKIVTYTGKADRYSVRDETGHRHYFRRGEAVEVADEVAARLPDGKFTVEAAAATPRRRTSQRAPGQDQSSTTQGSSEENSQ